PNNTSYQDDVQQVLAASFRAEGQAGMDRLTPDEANRLCSEADYKGKPLSDKVAEKIRSENFKAIQWPANGQFIGDYKLGEAIAQDGRGKTWSDKEGSVNGGNCYNCHKISAAEISHGTLGPSLYNYGKLRGITDVNSATAKPIVEYTWAKLWNARGYNACSNMPRFGHNGILTEAQLQHLMALLLDPKSPINQ
ncbi:MAG: sulfur oxidation c-type cytochrome SoxX, partial [Burkholderiales bacterium]